jgi:hypothetical protein
LLLVALAVGCGSSATRTTAEPPLRTVRKALVAKLNRQQLTFRWVACVRNGRRYNGMPIVRCNVNFGMDPHVEAYCTVFDHGRLVTNHENTAIPCGHDDAGFTLPTARGS